MRIGIWCAYGRTLSPTEGIGVFTHGLACGLATLPGVDDVQLAIHAGDDRLVAASVDAGGGRIHVAAVKRQAWLDRWRWKFARRRHRRLCDQIAAGADTPRLTARRDATERAIKRIFARQRIVTPPGAAPRDVWLLPHVAVERPLQAPSVVVVHDMVPFHFAGVIKATDMESFRRRTQRVVENAALVGTMSQTICDVDIVGVLGCPREKVRIVAPAPPNDLGTPVDEATLFRAIPAASRPFLLYPAAYRTYKNHARLVEALAIIRRSGRPELQLIFTGFGPLPPELGELASTLGVADAVHAVGSVERDVLAALYRAAMVTVVPSLYEQGSFPVMEAIRCGCPATASDIPALREAFADFGEAVPFFDPRSPEAMAAAVIAVLADREGVRRQQQDAVASLPQRTWTHVAADWLAVLREAVAGSVPP